MKLKLASIALVVVVCGCASRPPSQPVTPVGQSALSPSAAANCIALKWATNAQQTVWIENDLANATAYNVYVPTQKPPGGSAALIRPGTDGKGSTVSFRGTDTGGLVQGITGQCQS